MGVQNRETTNRAKLMSGNAFSLPDDLGWQANDEVHKTIADWLIKTGRIQEKRNFVVGGEFRMFMEVAIAELSDDVYTIIKKYQGK